MDDAISQRYAISSKAIDVCVPGKMAAAPARLLAARAAIDLVAVAVRTAGGLIPTHSTAIVWR